MYIFFFTLALKGTFPFLLFAGYLYFSCFRQTFVVVVINNDRGFIKYEITSDVVCISNSHKIQLQDVMNNYLIKNI